MKLAAEEVDRVEVYVVVSPETPIKQATVAQSKPEDITGRYYVVCTVRPPRRHHSISLAMNGFRSLATPSDLDQLFEGVSMMISVPG